MTPCLALPQQQPRIDEVVQRIDEIFTLPQVALRLMEVANDPDAAASDVKGIMEGDAALSARVLRCVNSSAYGLRTKITNLQQAIAYLGLRQVRNLAMAAGVARLFGKEGDIGPYSRSGLWKHSISVGVCARLIAMRLKMKNFEDMFLAGLLHDIGIILEDQHVHRPFAAMMRGLDEGRTLVENEIHHLGFDHTALGGRVAAGWKFPEVVQGAIRFHHASANYRGEGTDVVRCVEVANLVCTLKGISSVGAKLLRTSRAAIDNLSLTRVLHFPWTF